MSHKTSLGAEQANYLPDPPRLQAQRITAWGAIGLGLVGIVIGIIGLMSAGDSQLLIISAMGIVPFIMGVVLLQIVSKKQGWSITVYENGFAYHHDGANGQAKWADVAAVWQRIRQDMRTKRLTAVFRVMLNDDTTLRIDQTYADILELGKTIQHRTRDQRLPIFEQAYQQNKPLPFGDIKLDPSGLTYKDNHLTWENLDKIDFTRHIVTIHKKGQKLPWATMNTHQIPNIFILTHMISESWGHSVDESRLY